MINQFNSKKVRNIIFATSTSLLVMTAPSVMAENNEICLPLHQSERGEILNAGSTASRHSSDNPGIVSISAFPGKDMRNSPENLTNFFRSTNVDADCFINNSMYSNSGTGVSLYVAGIAIKHNGKTSFSIQELRDTPEILKAARAEATVAKILLTN